MKNSPFFTFLRRGNMQHFVQSPLLVVFPFSFASASTFLLILLLWITLIKTIHSIRLFISGWFVVKTTLLGIPLIPWICSTVWVKYIYYLLCFFNHSFKFSRFVNVRKVLFISCNFFFTFFFFHCYFIVGSSKIKQEL